MADPIFVLTVLIIAIALIFDYVNGFHDAANSIATVVSTRVLTPLQGVAWAAVWNFVAAFTFGTAVAKTIGSGLLDVQQVDAYVILAGLLGAIAWDLITWYVGLPTSSSHALIGAYAGAGIAKAGLGVIIPAGWVNTLIFIVLAPLLGMGLGMLNLVLILNIFKRSIPSNVDHIFRRGQLISAAAYSLGHGTNDAQKTMGIIAGALFTVPEYRYLVSDTMGKLAIPYWIVLLAHAAISLGTLSGGSLACNRSAVSPPKRRVQSHYSAPLISAFPFPPRIPLPARSSALARLGGFVRCAGMSRDELFGRGS